MAGSVIDNGKLTVVLVGLTGNGKSSTGNSILGRRAFKSRASSSDVTSTCELQRTKLKDGQTIDVIDTPGLFDFSAESEFIRKEIVNCMNLAKDGIHAVLVVLSVRARFTREEEAAFRSLKTLFGSKIIDYLIVVFTGGDELEENEETLEDYLWCDCPEPLKEILGLCENRRVLFDNKTKVETKRAKQVEELLSLINTVITKNGGQPYTYDMSVELKVLLKPKETIIEFQQQLAAEQAARLKAEMDAQAAQMKSNAEISKLNRYLENAQAAQKKSDTEIHKLIVDLQNIQAAEVKSNADLRKLSVDLEKAQSDTKELKQQLAVEQATRLKVQLNSQATQMKSNAEICKLRVDLENAQAAQMKSNADIHKLSMDLEKTQRVAKELEQQLAMKRAARLKVEQDAQKAQKNLDDEIRKLRVDIENAQAAQKKSNAEVCKLSLDLEKAQRDVEELKQQLTAKHAARVKAEQYAQEAQKKSNDEIRKLSVDLEKERAAQIKLKSEIHKLNKDLDEAQREVKDLHNKLEEQSKPPPPPPPSSSGFSCIIA